MVIASCHQHGMHGPAFSLRRKNHTTVAFISLGALIGSKFVPPNKRCILLWIKNMRTLHTTAQDIAVMIRFVIGKCQSKTLCCLYRCSQSWPSFVLANATLSRCISYQGSDMYYLWSPADISELPHLRLEDTPRETSTYSIYARNTFPKHHWNTHAPVLFLLVDDRHPADLGGSSSDP